MLTIEVFADELADILAARPKAARSDLLVHEGFELFRQGDVHRGHGRKIASLAKIGKISDGTSSKGFTTPDSYPDNIPEPDARRWTISALKIA